MKKSWLKKTWKWLLWAALIYIMIGAALFFLQDKFIFHPRKLPAGYQYRFDIPFREVEIPVTENKTLSIVQFSVPDSVRRGIVLYFHGNRENINRYAKYAVNFTRNQYEVWMLDYPGYGKSTGRRSEKILYEDALLFYKMAISRVPSEQIILYGKSLGTGIAAQLASVRDCKRLILETPYYSMDALARHYFFLYPVIPLSKYAIPTWQFLENNRAPVCIFHGTRDGVIPYRQAKKLSLHKPGAELVTIEKGKHNNLPDFPLYRQKLDSLLNN